MEVLDVEEASIPASSARVPGGICDARELFRFVQSLLDE